jgi:hypothetical protein
MMRNEPLTWVGVAGFEPAASSSRRQVAVPTASGAACSTWESPSVNVRWCPLLAMAIVTHLVTRSLASLSHEWLLRRTLHDFLQRANAQVTSQLNAS